MSACRHTCCAGWEIDIDEESFCRYREDGLPYISEEGTPHFILTEEERCPFLTPENLCSLILTHGEGYLCQICTDHPRFRNFWTGITEVGIGLSCEAAASIILGRKAPMRLVAEEEGAIETAVEALPEDERYLWEVRDALFREAAALEDPMQARLAEYFIFRQIPDALYDGLLEERIRFVWESVNRITELWERLPVSSLEAFIEPARIYSEKTEYDPEKLQEILRGLCSAVE